MPLKRSRDNPSLSTSKPCFWHSKTSKVHLFVSRGSSFGEIIFFETREAFSNFKGGQFALAAQASAVALTEGAGAAAKYDNGVAIFILQPKGLMLEASIGGQQFSFQALADLP